MRIDIDIEKKHFYFLISLTLFFGIVTVFAASPFNSGLGFHPLQQISKSDSNLVSVDVDLNEVIDNTDKLAGFGVSSFCQSDGTNCLQTQSAGVWNASTPFLTSCPGCLPGPPLTGPCSPTGKINNFTILTLDCGLVECTTIENYFIQTCVAP